ncbi:MAG TPA: redoxin domain-containing protein [Myxococcales bacterium]|nr:redoxin domain-containing protein [Myxococcales bacterium]
MASSVMEKRYQKYKQYGYQQYLVIQTGAAFGTPATATLCKQLREQYGLTFPVLYDPTGQLIKTYNGKPNEMNFVTGIGVKLLLKGQYTPGYIIEETLDKTLGL